MLSLPGQGVQNDGRHIFHCGVVDERPYGVNKLKDCSISFGDLATRCERRISQSRVMHTAGLRSMHACDLFSSVPFRLQDYARTKPLSGIFQQPTSRWITTPSRTRATTPRLCGETNPDRGRGAKYICSRSRRAFLKNSCDR